MAEFNYIFKDRSQERPPSICTKFWPEFKGTQMKLSQFVVKTKRIREEEIDNEQVDEIITTTASKQVDIEVNEDHLKRN